MVRILAFGQPFPGNPRGASAHPSYPQSYQHPMWISLSYQHSVNNPQNLSTPVDNLLVHKKIPVHVLPVHEPTVLHVHVLGVGPFTARTYT